MAFELLTSLRYDSQLRSAPWNTRRGNPPSSFFLLPLHLERLVAGAQSLGWVRALEALGVEVGAEGKIDDALERFKSLCQKSVDTFFAEHPEHNQDSEKALKIRITLSKDGVLHATATPTPPRPYDLLALSLYDPAALTAATNVRDATTLPPLRHPPIRVLLDTQPTPTPNPHLAPHKTTARGVYDAARTRAGIPPLTSTAPAPARPTEVLLHTPGNPAFIIDASIRTPFFYRAGRWVTPVLQPSADVLAPLAGTVRRFLLEHGRAVEGDVPLGEVQVGEWVLLCNAVEGCVVGIVEG